MATGLEAYDALKAATANLPDGSSFVIHGDDAKDLGKLTISDLISRDYPESRAELVSSTLREDNLDELGKSMLLELSVSYDAPALIET